MQTIQANTRRCKNGRYTSAMSERGKTAIIMVGGGMKSAHGAGFLYALGTELGITEPDIIIGSSGDAGNVLYFCSGQYESGKHIWMELLSTPKFISLIRFWRLMDIDYLIDVVFRQQEPLDEEKLRMTPIQWLIPISDYDTGRTLYSGAHDNLDPFEILRAAKATPFLFRKYVSLARRRYIDGEFGPTLQDHVAQVLSRGARNIVIINHFRTWTRPKKLLMRLWAHLVPLGLHDAVIRDISTDVKLFSAPHARVLFLSPQGLPCGTATRNKEKIKATFDRGVQDALALKDELQELFR